MIYVSIMWDDGLVTDLKLMEIARKYNLTSNFAISPARHSKYRKPNDSRGNYGEIVSQSELKEFSDFEISNHTANHVELTKVSLEIAKKEINEGRSRLESIYGREIKGFCYPYGQYNLAIADILRNQDYLYARTTKTFKSSDPLMLNPTCKWNEVYHEEFVVLWGHSYEIERWDEVNTLYKSLAENDNVNVITFEEMVRRQNENNSRVRIL